MDSIYGNQRNTNLFSGNGAYSNLAVQYVPSDDVIVTKTPSDIDINHKQSKESLCTQDSGYSTQPEFSAHL